jgi:hypothetical protein
LFKTLLEIQQGIICANKTCTEAECCIDDTFTFRGNYTDCAGACGIQGATRDLFHQDCIKAYDMTLVGDSYCADAPALSTSFACTVGLCNPTCADQNTVCVRMRFDCVDFFSPLFVLGIF